MIELVEASFKATTIPAVKAYELRWRKLIRAPIEVCWKYWNEDPELMAQRHPNIKSVKLILREGDLMINDIVHEVGGKRLRTIERTIAYPMKKLESEYIDGDGQGNKYTMSFDPVSEGTILTTVGVYLLKDDREAAEWLEQGRKYVERDTQLCEEIARGKSK